MNEEGSLFDVPPAAIGRYLVRQPLGTGTTGPVFHGQDPETHAAVAIKLFKVDLSPDEAHGVARALARLVDQTPRHVAIVPPLDAGLDEIEAFFVTAVVEGDSLESALRDFGPAAIEDVLPRLQGLAEALDAAHGALLVHGALHPRDIVVSPDTTHLTGVGVAPVLARAGVAVPLRRPYSAPEAGTGTGATAPADQYSLAAITFEWLFGRRISGPAERPVEVRALPGVDREALSNAFTTALAPDARDRYESCAAFAEAVVRAAGGAGTTTRVKRDEDVPRRVEPPFAPIMLDDAVTEPPVVDDEDRIGPLVPEPVSARVGSMSAQPATLPERFGGGVLVITLLVGLAVGFAAGYMARPRALQSGPPRQMSSVGTDAAVAPAPLAPAPLALAPKAPTPQAPQAPKALKAPSKVPLKVPSKAPLKVGMLAVESRPSGARVTINGRPSGTTPLTLEALAPGEYRVSLALPGYRPFSTTVRVVAGARARAGASLSVQERE